MASIWRDMHGHGYAEAEGNALRGLKELPILADYV
jgi:hypothetical protein